MQSFEERCQLLMTMKLKKIKMKDLATELQCSVSWCSQFFNGKVDWNQATIDKALSFVNSK